MTESELNDKLNVKQTGLSLFHVNARSLTKNFDNFELCLDSLNVKFDIIAVSENWLDKESKDSYNISGYQVIHVVREKTRGGGCSLYIKNAITYKLVKSFTACIDKLYECVAVEIKVGGKACLVCCVYKTLSGDITEFNNHFEELLNIQVKVKSLCLY